VSSVSSTEIKERVRQSVDIVDVVGNAISLRRQGRIFVGLCPFHDDSKPSLQVNPERQTWKCWVCGDKGGDVFSWVMERERVEFKDALKLLAEKAGIALETRERPTVAGSADDKKTLFDCCAWAEKQFHEYLLRSEGAEPGRKYLEERSITPHSVERF
jgi:DNA primase